jgi:hypothetical protein
MPEGAWALSRVPAAQYDELRQAAKTALPAQLVGLRLS